MNAFTNQEQKLVDVLSEHENETDIFIDEMYGRVYGYQKTDDTPPFRQRQQRVASIISRVNKKLEAKKLRIVPGEYKRTYRLTRVP